MKLTEWVSDLFKNGPEIWSDEKVIVNDKGIAVRRDTFRLRNCSLGLVSVSGPEEWYRICRLNCPPGTIIEDYKEEEWAGLYQDMLSLVRNELTKALLTERGNKSAKILLEIMERRDKEHWSDGKQSSVELKRGDETITFKFEEMKK